MVYDIRIAGGKDGRSHPLATKFCFFGIGGGEYELHIIGIILDGRFCQFHIKQRGKNGIIIPWIHDMGAALGAQGVVPFRGLHLVPAIG